LDIASYDNIRLIDKVLLVVLNTSIICCSSSFVFSFLSEIINVTVIVEIIL